MSFSIAVLNDRSSALAPIDLSTWSNDFFSFSSLTIVLISVWSSAFNSVADLISALSFNVDISSHFKHDKNTNCSFEKFINQIPLIDRGFYSFWTSFFIFESIKNTFNSESRFHVLYEDIMIQISHKQLKPEQIKKKEHYGTNNQKVIWILQVNDETRNELNKVIIKRNYWSDLENMIDTKYYIASNSNYYYLYRDYNNAFI